MQTMLVQEHKDQIIYTKIHEVLMSFDQSYLSTEEGESLHYTIKNIIEDWIKYNY